MVVLVDVVVDGDFDLNLYLNLVATIDAPGGQTSPKATVQRALTVKGGDQVQVQVHVKVDVHDTVNAHVNENLDELPDTL